MYENKRQQVISHQQFMRRLRQHLWVALALLIGSLAMGMVGYKVFEQLAWIDGFLNSALLLGGMGPVNPPLTEAGKLFAGMYALYAGLVFVVTAALMVTPVAHRLLHRFHCDDDVGSSD